ncbi:uncharacterized protein ACIBXB_022142 [Morphnus guianensis]
MGMGAVPRGAGAALLVVADVAHSPLQAANWAPLNMFPKPRSGPRTVATSHCLDLMIRLVQQTGHSVARLPRDAQMGAAGPVPPQPPACPPLPALRTGLSSSSSSDAASVNSELEVLATVKETAADSCDGEVNFLPWDDFVPQNVCGADQRKLQKCRRQCKGQEGAASLHSQG